MKSVRQIIEQRNDELFGRDKRIFEYDEFFNIGAVLPADECMNRHSNISRIEEDDFSHIRIGSKHTYFAFFPEDVNHSFGSLEVFHEEQMLNKAFEIMTHVGRIPNDQSLEDYVTQNQHLIMI